jgi:hypothetical protein
MGTEEKKEYIKSSNAVFTSSNYLVLESHVGYGSAIVSYEIYGLLGVWLSYPREYMVER